MSNQISEDVPAPSSSAPSAGAGGSQEKLEKQARQLAYDVKYKVKQQMNRGTKMDPAAVKKAYISFLGKSTGTPAVKALAKKKLIGEELVQEDLDTKYKVRVTDKQTGNTYVRMATRAKISELRANTNIASVEMTGYGEPTKSEKTKGSQTAAAKSGKDYDGDGKKESSSKEHAGVVHNAIQKKKGGKQDGQDTRKEEFIADANNNKEDIDKEIKELKGKKNKVKIMPTMGEDAKHGYDKDGNSLNPDDVKKKNEKDPNGEAKKEEEEDPRSMGTKYRNMKNKLRAMGLNMGFDISGKKLDEEVPVDAKQEKNTKEIESKQKKADVIKRQVLIKKLQAVRAGGGASVTASYKPEGEVIDEKKKGLDGKECWDGYSLKGTKKKGDKTVDNCVKVDENRMAAYTAGAGEGSPASRPTVSKKTADKVSRSSDEHAFGNRKKKEGIRLSPTKKYSGKDKGKTVKRANTTGRGTPTQYRKSHEDPDMGRYQQKVTQGSGSVKGLKKEHHQKGADGNTIPHEQINEVAPLIAAAGKVAMGAVKAKAKQVVTQKATQAAGAVADRVQKPIGAVESYKSESNTVRDILELNRFEKETGTSSGSLNMPKGKPTQKGGTASPVMRAVRTSIRKETGKPQGQEKKVKGAKPPVAGEYGARKSPAQIVQKRRSDKASATAAMSDTRGT